jgi:hypothetical protein
MTNRIVSESEKIHQLLNKELQCSEVDIETVQNLFEQLYFQSQRDNYFWQFCPFSVYENTYNERLSSFLRNTIDANENDFVRIELVLIESFVGGIEPEENGYKYFLEENGKRTELFIFRVLSEKMIYNIVYSTQKKLKWIESFFSGKINSENQQSTDLEIPEYNAKSIKEKIALLNELGIIEHLSNIHPFNYANGLAKILKVIMKESETTLQPYLNCIIGNTEDSSKNPLKPSIIKEVQTKLINMGVDSNKLKTTLKNR